MIFYKKEKSITKNLEGFLEKVVQNKVSHAHWLNTLAFMEHIGSRKIIKSQNSTYLDIDLLQHISEEARHAFYFKNLAHKVSPKDCLTFEPQYLIKGNLSEDYFQAVDHKVEEVVTNLPDKNILNYLYTTWIIEERAVFLYTVYNKLLLQGTQSHPLQGTQSPPFNLNFILREEDNHLLMVKKAIEKKDPNAENRSQHLFTYEEDQFLNLVQHWTSALTTDKN